MNEIYDKVKKCYKQVREKTDFKPQIAMILGSGLGDYAETIEIKEIIDYHEIDGFPISTVQGHKGRFVLGYVEDIPVMIMEGRVHYYEGYSTGQMAVLLERKESSVRSDLKRGREKLKMILKEAYDFE